VSVIIPVFNAATFITEAITSIQRQTYESFEVVLIDDGSTDASYQMMEILASQDSRLRVMRQENGGPAAARNAGIGVARGEFVAFLDSDDVAHPERLRRQVDYLDDHPHVCLVGGAVRHITPQGDVIADHVLGPAITSAQIADSQTRRLNNALQTTTTMLRRDAFLEAGGFREQFRSAEDYDLWLRLQPRPMANLQEVMCSYRRHPSQITSIRGELTLFSAAMAHTSYVCRMRGVADPAEAWKGNFDLPCLLGAKPDPMALARLFAGLLVLAAIADRRQLEQTRLTPKDLARALVGIDLSQSRLKAADAAPLFQGTRALFTLGFPGYSVRFAASVVRHCPSQALRAATRPLRQRLGLTRRSVQQVARASMAPLIALVRWIFR